MKPTTLRTGKFILVLAALVLTAGLVSWDQRYAPGHIGQVRNDTTPKKKQADKKVKDLDDVIDEIDNADIKFDGEKIKAQLEEAMKQLDAEKIRAEIERSMAKVDMEKVKKDMELALKEIDMTRIEKEIKESMAKIDWDKMKVEFDKVKDIDMKKLQEQLEKVKEINTKDLEEQMAKMKEDLKDIGPRIEKEMEKVKEEMEKVKADMKEYKEFVDGLEKDGLINKKEGYSLKYKDGELKINDKKADQKVLDKYRSFLEKHKKFNIEKSDDDFNIHL